MFTLSRGGRRIPLPPPRRVSSLSVEEALLRRRSVRTYLPQPLRLEELSMLLWAAQGVSDPRRGFRTAPSAGATYPLIAYAVIGDGCVEGLKAGVYRYVTESHSLTLHKPGDVRDELGEAAYSQEWVRSAPVTIAFSAVFSRTTLRYGRRGFRYVFMDVGHAAQNVYLMATALGLGTVAVGAFRDEGVSATLSLSAEETPIYLMPVGRAGKVDSVSFEELEKLFRSEGR